MKIDMWLKVWIIIALFLLGFCIVYVAQAKRHPSETRPAWLQPQLR